MEKSVEQIGYTQVHTLDHEIIASTAVKISVVLLSSSQQRAQYDQIHLLTHRRKWLGCDHW